MDKVLRVAPIRAQHLTVVCICSSCSVYIPALYVLNKIDSISVQELDILDRIPHVVPICAYYEWNFDELLDTIWTYLDMNRMCVTGRRSICDLCFLDVWSFDATNGQMLLELMSLVFS